jgi:hypothetical protein
LFDGTTNGELYPTGVVDGMTNNLCPAADWAYVFESWLFETDVGTRSERGERDVVGLKIEAQYHILW